MTSITVLTKRTQIRVIETATVKATRATPTTTATECWTPMTIARRSSTHCVLSMAQCSPMRTETARGTCATRRRCPKILMVTVWRMGRTTASAVSRVSPRSRFFWPLHPIGRLRRRWSDLVSGFPPVHRCLWKQRPEFTIRCPVRSARRWLDRLHRFSTFCQGIQARTMRINTNLPAENAQRHLSNDARNLEATFKAAASGSGDIVELSTGLAKDKLLTTASTLVLRKANDLQGRQIDLVV